MMNGIKKNIEFIKNITNKVEMISYSRKDFNNRHPKLVENLSILDFVNRYTHFKLIFHEYLDKLKEYDQIIFFDADLIIIDDIMYLKGISNIGWRADKILVNCKNSVVKKPNGGVLIFNKELPIDDMKEIFIQQLLICNNDEIALAKMACLLNLKVNYLPLEYNVGSYLIARSDSENLKIFHCVGEKKIWNDSLYQYLFPEYIPYIKKYNENICKIQTLGIYQNRFSFVKSVFLYHNYSLYNIHVYNKYIRLFTDIVKNEYIYFYKNIKNMYFQIIGIHVNKFRLHFNIDNENIFKINEIIKNNLELYDMIIKYNYHEYEKNRCTYFIDCFRFKLEYELNYMISVFTYIIDEYSLYKNKYITQTE